MSSWVEVSVVTTSYKSEKFMRQFIDALEFELQKVTTDFEIVLVDDHSPDSSWEHISALSKTNPRLKSILLSRNYGQQIATSAGILASNGKYVIVMDGDFENPLNLIPEIYERLKKGLDFVYVTCPQRQSFSRKVTSDFFWLFARHVLKVNIVPGQLMIRGFQRKMALKFSSYKEHIRNIAILSHILGGSYEVIETSIGSRVKGTKSNAGLLSRLNQFFDLVTILSNRPLNWLLGFGIFLFLASACLILFVIWNYFFRAVLPGFTGLITAISFFGSINILLLSLIGRYLSNIYSEVRQRPLYHIQKVFNLDPSLENT